MSDDHPPPLRVRHPTESRTYRRLRWELWLIFILIVIGLLYLRYGNEVFELGDVEHIKLFSASSSATPGVALVDPALDPTVAGRPFRV